MLGATVNGVIAIAYLAIGRAIVVPLARAHELRTNALGVATAAIFVTAGVHHGSHTVQLLLPYAEVDVERGLLMRQAATPWLAGWDVLGMAAVLCYWVLRRYSGAGLRGSSLYEDLHQRQQDAIEINDLVVQSLVAAQLARASGRDEELDRALARSLTAARTVVDRLLAAGGHGLPGDFVRSTPSDLGPR